MVGGMKIQGGCGCSNSGGGCETRGGGDIGHEVINGVVEVLEVQASLIFMVHVAVKGISFLEVVMVFFHFDVPQLKIRDARNVKKNEVEDDDYKVEEMTTLAEFMIVVGAENRPPMLDKAMYNSWERRMLLYIKGKKNGRMMLESIENGPFVYPTVEVDGQIRKKKYTELTEQEQLQDDCDVQATKIVLQGTELSYQERECKLYNEFDKFTSVKRGTLHEYYLRFAQLINDMHTTSMTMQQVQFPQTESGLVVLVFLPGDDPIACLNKAMAFMSIVVASHFPSTNSQLRTSSNPRNQATIQDGRVTVQQVQGRQGQSFAGTRTKGNVTTSRGNNAAGQARVVKCYNYQGEGHMSRQCTQPKRPRNASWFKEKLMLPIIIHKAAFQTDDLDAYDSDCDDISSAKAVLMANLSSYGSNVLLELSKKMSNHVTNWDKVNQETKKVNESLTAKLERYKECVKTLEQRFNVDLNNREKFIDSQMDNMIRNSFDKVVKVRTTPDAITEGSWGFEHTKKVFKEEVIPFINSLRVSFKDFENGLHNELNEVKTVFNQMEAAVDSVL
ncbi:hypothetical protein Tco_1045472 [Tanacetum coccineum]|uniref:Uncharacterized protein n=1 Tax=Tanacetum coccineum TaxID=301880 RepID=A0ABQ5GUS7_9ASTR